MKKASIKLALLNHVGGGNLGDDATLSAVARSIQMRWPDAEIHAITMNPQDSESRHGIPCHKIRRQTWSIKRETTSVALAPTKEIGSTFLECRQFWLFLKRLGKRLLRLPNMLIGEALFLNASRKKIRQFEILVVCGGGQLTERDGSWAFPYTLLKWIVLARIARVRCMFLNVGAGPLSHRLSKAFVRCALSLSEYVSFRDDQSLKLARQIGFSGICRVFPDNAYTLRCSPSLVEPRKIGKRETVGFAPVPYGDPRLHPNERNSVAYERIVSGFAALSSGLVARDYAMVLFGTDIGVDPPVITDVMNVIGKLDGAYRPQYSAVESVEDLLASMSAMDYVITCRFHGVIFAHLLNKPVLAIAHHPKVRDLMISLGLAKYCLDIETFEPIRTIDVFASLVRDAEVVREKMATSLATYRSQLAGQFDELFSPRNMQTQIVGRADARRTNMLTTGSNRS